MVDVSSQFSISSSDHKTRFLLPFFWRRNALQQAETALLDWRHESQKAWRCWEKPETVPALYQDEVLPSACHFLFGNGGGSCTYFRVPDETAIFWFKNGGIVAKAGESEKPDAAQSPFDISKRLNKFDVQLATPGIELFLSPHGAGVLSVTFTPKRRDTPRFLQEFNYRLAQVRKFTAYPFRLLHGSQNPNPPPALDAPLSERLGQAGGAFTLMEWTEFLLQPLRSLGYRPMQHQFSVYSVTRFDESARFSDVDGRAGLHTFLAAVAHVEEFHHVGSLQVCEQLLNPCHWAAVGSLGASHLVCDQNPIPHDFDEQRLAISLHKYFIPYLVALMQRIVLQGILEEARDIMISRCEYEPDESSCWIEPLRKLNRHTLAFTVNGWFTEISSREAVNQYYALAQRGLRVQDSFQTLRRALHDMEAMDNNHFQNDALNKMGELAKQANHSIGIVAHVQSKVEWLEVFFVSYYATALVYYLKGSHLLDDTYAKISLLAAPLLAGVVAFWRLRPDKLHQHGKHRNQPLGAHSTQSRDKGSSAQHSRAFMTMLIVAYLAWLAVGLGQHLYETAAPASSSSPESGGLHTPPPSTLPTKPEEPAR